ncbi:ArpA protein [Streptomyces sp. NPDC000151]|uniref:HalD/BesD family halogenase n=1 Tax=Streptomyces sp. NPDC000151 TaxID=3154244 RepID=UPI0033332A67
MTLLSEAVAAFRRHGAVKVPAPSREFRQLADEARALAEQYGVRRELEFAETGHTPRRMRNVRCQEISAHGRAIPALYDSPEIRAVLGEVAGEEVLTCPYEPERFVITELRESGDTHGWHWDDYSFALVWVVDCPPPRDGGSVQYVPGTTWNKADPQLHRQLAAGPVRTLDLRPGDRYLMRTDTTLHRVTPLRRGRRLIVNMAYAARRDLAKEISHTTMDGLWAPPASPGDQAGRDVGGDAGRPGGGE